MSKKNTKKALFSSVLALILCFSMLVGTTFAWFTDEVTSSMNQIVAGNLDVELTHTNKNEKDQDVQDTETLFKDVTLWEPGAVAYETLMVKNVGTLALKYQLSINFENTNSVTVDGNEYVLSQALKVGVIEGTLGDDTTRDGLLGAVAEWKPLESFTMDGTLDAKTNATPVTVVIYWEPTGNDNNWNVNNGNKTSDGEPLSINLGVKLFATQLTAEEDSFGKDYDDGAYLPIVYTEAELKSALENNESVQLGGNIALTETWTPIGDKDAGVYYTGTLEGNGYTISGLNVTANDYDALISAAKDATIKNLTVEGVVNGVNAAGIVARVEGNTVIENCVSNVTVTGTTKAGGIVCNVTGADAKIINCTNNGAVSCSNAKAGGVGGIIGYVNTNAYVEVINCTNNGAVTGTDGQTTGAVVGYAATNSSGLIAGFANTGVITGKNYVGDGNGRWIEDENGLVLAGYCGTPANWINAKTIASAADLFALSGTKISGTYAVVADIDMTGYEMKPIMLTSGSDNTLTFIGNGHTISNLTLVQDYQNGMYVAGLFNILHSGSELNISDLTLSNVTSTSKKYAAALVAYNSTALTINLNNVDVDNATVKAETVAALVGYTTGAVNLTDCDVSNISLSGEAANKIGAYVGTANQASCVVAVKNCTNGTAYNYAGRVINGATMTVDGVTYVTNADGLANAVANGATNILLADGEYDVYGCGGKTLTISGSKNAVIKLYNEGEDGCDYAFGGNGTGVGNITFNGLTIDTTANTGNYKGFAYMKGIFNDCYFVGAYSLNNANDFEFNRCTFDFKNGYFWTWGANSVTFDGCTFNGNSKNILAHGYASTVININNCTFAATEKGYTGAGDNTAAVEIDPAGTNTYTINFTGENTITENYAGWTRVKDGSTGHTITGLN